MNEGRISMRFAPFLKNTYELRNIPMRKLAIVILNWNGCEMMKKYLPSVIGKSAGDVIVADNASTDNSIEMLSQTFPDVRTIRLDKNYGFAEGYNQALAQLPNYEYYLLLNSDVEIRQQGWDKVLTDYMDAHPDCAACQPKLLDLQRLEEEERKQEHHKQDDASKGKKTENASERLKKDCAPEESKTAHIYFEYAGCAGGFLDKYGYPFCRGRILNTVEEDKGQYDDIRTVMWATGAALLCRATDWRASGGLDGRFFAHMEEIDLCWRLRTMGKDIVCVPGSTAYHLGGATLNQGNPRKTFLNFRNNLLMLYKNLPENELHTTMHIRTLLDYLAALQFLLKGDLANMRAVIRARSAFNRMKKDYKTVRQSIQTSRTIAKVPERMDISILWQYYVKGRHTFNALGQ